MCPDDIYWFLKLAVSTAGCFVLVLGLVWDGLLWFLFAAASFIVLQVESVTVGYGMLNAILALSSGSAGRRLSGLVCGCLRVVCYMYWYYLVNIDQFLVLEESSCGPPCGALVPDCQKFRVRKRSSVFF